jgi:hypothetical protein
MRFALQYYWSHIVWPRSKFRRMCVQDHKPHGPEATKVLELDHREVNAGRNALFKLKCLVTAKMRCNSTLKKYSNHIPKGKYAVSFEPCNWLCFSLGPWMHRHIKSPSECFLTTEVKRYPPITY